jgi:hypothetical protein
MVKIERRKIMSKKTISIILVITALILLFAGCNMQVMDTTYSFEEVCLAMPDGEIIEGKVQSWGDYENSDMIQVKVDGKTYLTHITNVVLISK